MKQKKFEEANEIMKTSAKDLIKFLETRYPDFEFNYTDTEEEDEFNEFSIITLTAVLQK